MSIRRKLVTPVTEKSPYQNGEAIEEVDESFYDDDFLDEFDETFDDSHYEQDNLSIPSSDHSRNYPVTCKVIYPYQVRFLNLLTFFNNKKLSSKAVTSEVFVYILMLPSLYRQPEPMNLPLKLTTQSRLLKTVI